MRFPCLGLLGLVDPPRPDVREAIHECQEAGIRVVMVTGDQPATAIAIARHVGLVHEKKPSFIHGNELRDDAFPSIVTAVRQGRIIFGNIRKSVLFMLCTNVAEVIAVAVASAAGGFIHLPIPLLPLQILYLNVITDAFPALALSMGQGETGIMRMKPRPCDESILTRNDWKTIGGWALLISLCVLSALAIAFYGFGFDEPHAVTISFLTLAFGKLWFVFNLRAPGKRNTQPPKMRENSHVYTIHTPYRQDEYTYTLSQTEESVLI